MKYIFNFFIKKFLNFKNKNIFKILKKLIKKNILKIYYIWNIKELRIRIFNTLFYLIIYRFSTFIPLPGIKNKDLNKYILINHPNFNGMIQIFYSFTGGCFLKYSILSLGLMPYISSSIMIQLLSYLIPYLQKLQKEGDSGNNQIIKLTRLLTLLISFIQSYFYIFILKNNLLPILIQDKNPYIFNIKNIYFKTYFYLLSTILLVTGTIFTMWLGEMISNKGIGNGISLIIMIGIIVNFPNSFINEIYYKKKKFTLFLEIILFIIIISFSIAIFNLVKKIPIIYVKNSLLLKKKKIKYIYNYFSIKVLHSGVLPIIFSQSMMFFPIIYLYINKKMNLIGTNWYVFFYNLSFFLFIIIFTYFYNNINLQESNISENLKKNYSYIPEVAPGKQTEEYLSKILKKITIPGSILLGLLSLFPNLSRLIGITENFSLFYGGSSLLITIGVLIDLLQIIETFILNSYYDKIVIKY